MSYHLKKPNDIIPAMVHCNLPPETEIKTKIGQKLTNKQPSLLAEHCINQAIHYKDIVLFYPM